MGDELGDSAERLFAAHSGKDMRRAAEAGGFPQALWNAIDAAGFPAALLPEEAGGFGLTPAEALRLLRVAAAHALPIPLAETMLAQWLCAKAGLAIPSGVLTVAPVRGGDRLALSRTDGGWRLAGTAKRVPFARNAAAIVVLADGPDGPMLACAAPSGFRTEPGVNLAAEPRDTVVFDGPAPASLWPLAPASLRAAGAALRTAQIAGALARLLSLCVAYAQGRVQFGRPIGKFQAIQHALAVLAGQAAAAGAAADMAGEALAGDLDPLVIGAAKARAGEAAGIAAGIAHQSHGAIGFTREYELHYLTRRLWSWRDEFGNEAEWNALVGRAALRAGADGLWPMIAGGA
jgi:acyl-CoA dehydrogenase